MPQLASHPAVDSLEGAFPHPAVQNAQARQAIQRRFHATRAGSLERKLRRIEPQVHAGSNLPAKLEIVIVKENHRHCPPQRFFRLKNPSDNVLSSAIIRVRLAGKDNLELAGILGNLPQTIEISKDQVGALVSGCAARETDCKNLRIKLEAGLQANRLQQFVLGNQMSSPDFLRPHPNLPPQPVLVVAPRKNA